MKKIIALLCVVAMIFVVVACNKTNDPDVTTPDTEGEGSEQYIALVTDVGNIDDKSFNQGTWEGVLEFADANGIRRDYFRPTEPTPAARVQSINEAIAAGATVVVLPGYLFETVVFELQDQHPDVEFILIDGEPNDGDWANEAGFPVYKTADNVHNILYQEEQAGYLAGYAAVKEGFTKLGFLGGMAVPAVIRYGYGFVQGADAAAAEMGIAEEITINYWYCGHFGDGDNDAVKIKMGAWYSEGVEVIFSCGGGIYVPCLAAANEAGAKVIGVDVDQSAEGEAIVTSAMKGLRASTALTLTALMNNNWEWPAEYAGKTAVLGADVNAVGLPTADGSWRLENFTVADYEVLFGKLASGEIVVDNSSDATVYPESTIVVNWQN